MCLWHPTSCHGFAIDWHRHILCLWIFCQTLKYIYYYNIQHCYTLVSGTPVCGSHVSNVGNPKWDDLALFTGSLDVLGWRATPDIVTMVSPVPLNIGYKTQICLPSWYLALLDLSGWHPGLWKQVNISAQNNLKFTHAGKKFVSTLWGSCWNMRSQLNKHVGSRWYTCRVKLTRVGKSLLFCAIWTA